MTHSVIRRTILILWVVTLMLVCGPFVGFGLWYDESLTPHCVRYRFGTELVDRIYAYVIFAYGTALRCILFISPSLYLMQSSRDNVTMIL